MTVKTRAVAATPGAKLSRALTKHLLSDFEEHGSEVIAKMRSEKPVDYVKLVTAILEKEDANQAASVAPLYTVVERQIVPAPHQDG